MRLMRGISRLLGRDGRAINGATIKKKYSQHATK